MVQIVLTIVAIIGLLLALVGIIIPGLPGIPILWGLVLIDHFILGYLELSTATIIWLSVLGVLTLVIDYLATALGVKKRGGSTAGTIGSVLGLILGLVIFNVPGMLIGCFIGALLGEVLQGHELKPAASIALGALLGYATATVLKLGAWLVYGIVIFYNIFS